MIAPCLSLVSPSSTTLSLSLAGVQGTHVSTSTLERCVGWGER